MRADQASSSALLNALSSESIRCRCSTGSNISDRSPPTACVGESAETSSGCAASSSSSSRKSVSYSASDSVAESST